MLLFLFIFLSISLSFPRDYRTILERLHTLRAMLCAKRNVLCLMCYVCNTHPLILSLSPVSRLLCASGVGGRIAHNDPSGDRCDAFLFCGQQDTPSSSRYVFRLRIKLFGFMLFVQNDPK